MAKRFTDTDKWKRQFLRGLNAAGKLFWFYICDDCDHAGIWHVDIQVAEIRVGEKIEVAEFLKKLGEKIVVFDDGAKWFIPSFIEFQYPKGLIPGNNAHDSVISILTKYKLIEHLHKPLPSPSRGAQDKDMDKDMDWVKKGKRSVENQKKPAKEAAEVQRQKELQGEYSELCKASEGVDDRETFKKIKGFVQEKRPSFAEPYVDAWNIFAPSNNLSRVEQISAARRDKIRIRTREPAFDFFKILSSIRQNAFYRGESPGGWRVDFNHVIESEDNYLKIIEKHRDN